jgi:hypothetical protein
MSDKRSQEWENIADAVDSLETRAYLAGERAERERIVAFLCEEASARTSSLRLVIEALAKRIEGGEGV